MEMEILYAAGGLFAGALLMMLKYPEGRASILSRITRKPHRRFFEFDETGTYSEFVSELKPALKVKGSFNSYDIKAEDAYSSKTATALPVYALLSSIGHSLRFRARTIQIPTHYEKGDMCDACGQEYTKDEPRDGFLPADIAVNVPTAQQVNSSHLSSIRYFGEWFNSALASMARTPELVMFVMVLVVVAAWWVGGKADNLGGSTNQIGTLCAQALNASRACAGAG